MDRGLRAPKGFRGKAEFTVFFNMMERAGVLHHTHFTCVRASASAGVADGGPTLF